MDQEKREVEQEPWKTLNESGLSHVDPQFFNGPIEAYLRAFPKRPRPPIRDFISDCFGMGEARSIPSTSPMETNQGSMGASEREEKEPGVPGRPAKDSGLLEVE